MSPKSLTTQASPSPDFRRTEQTPGQNLKTRGQPAIEHTNRPATNAELEMYLLRAKRLRAEEMQRIFGSVSGWLRGLFVGRAPMPTAMEVNDPLSQIADALRGPLTSIRSSAEILRDSPDLDPSERQRFVTAVLAEEARLERVVNAVLTASEVENSPEVLRVRLGRLDLHHLKSAA